MKVCYPLGIVPGYFGNGGRLEGKRVIQEFGLGSALQRHFK